MRKAKRFYISIERYGLEEKTGHEKSSGDDRKMERSKAVELLEKSGYDIDSSNNIPTALVTCTTRKEFDRKVQEIEKLLKNNGYNSSFGVRMNHGAARKTSGESAYAGK